MQQHFIDIEPYFYTVFHAKSTFWLLFLRFGSLLEASNPVGDFPVPSLRDPRNKR